MLLCSYHARNRESDALSRMCKEEFTARFNQRDILTSVLPVGNEYHALLKCAASLSISNVKCTVFLKVSSLSRDQNANEKL